MEIGLFIGLVIFVVAALLIKKEKTKSDAPANGTKKPKPEFDEFDKIDP
jgi:hypothetical protein